MTDSRIRELNRLGQSIWYDNIRRGLIESGDLQRLIDLGITGLTSNPTIFEKAIGQSTDYDAALRDLVGKGVSDPVAVFEELAVADIQAACDLLRPVYHATQGADGYASYEVPPEFAHDTQATIEQARRLNARLARPNVMIKVPATAEGMDAIRVLTAEGVNVNITLIFALEAYRQVIEAFLRGLEARRDRGLPVDGIASVASFFVSRIDTLVDKRLEERIASATSDDERQRLKALEGKAAIANAKLAYQMAREVFDGERFAALARAGARMQRPLWASTSTKNPAYPDTYYVDNLIGPDTVDTLPPQTIDAFNDHGTLALTVGQNFDEAREMFDRLAEVGIDIRDVTAQVLDEGVKSFAKSYETLVDALKGKIEQLTAVAPEAGTPQVAVPHADMPQAVAPPPVPAVSAGAVQPADAPPAKDKKKAAKKDGGRNGKKGDKKGGKAAAKKGGKKTKATAKDSGKGQKKAKKAAKKAGKKAAKKAAKRAGKKK